MENDMEENTNIVDKRRFGTNQPDESASQFSPAASPNKEMAGMDFGTALKTIVHGGRVTKLEWADPNIYLLMFMWGASNPNTPAGMYLTIHHADGTMHPLCVNDGDILGEDWVVVS